MNGDKSKALISKILLEKRNLVQNNGSPKIMEHDARSCEPGVWVNIEPVMASDTFHVGRDFLGSREQAIKKGASNTGHP